MYEDEISRVAFTELDMVRHLLALLPADVVPGLDTSALPHMEEPRMLAETVTQWRQEAHDEGRRQGMFEGERALLRRIAAARFGVATGNALATLVANEEDIERLARVGDLVGACASAEELLRRGRSLLNGGS